MAHFNNRRESSKAKFFRGLSIGSTVSHIYDSSVRGEVKDIDIPLVYVKFTDNKKTMPMDRDELILLDREEELEDMGMGDDNY